MAIYSACAILAETVSGAAKARPDQTVTDIWHGDGSGEQSEMEICRAH
ncbi:MAG: hypothetical protein PUE47_02870 [Lachnospiraceae bacterium]|nr:hypothetical protein [Lachnospiraceae bacterium]